MEMNDNVALVLLKKGLKDYIEMKIHMIIRLESLRVCPVLVFMQRKELKMTLM